MELEVYSEVAPLEAVVVHPPGEEIDVMVPSLMGELLFDDILFRENARFEHQAFRSVLEVFAAEVLDVQGLLAEALEEERARARFLSRLRTLHLCPDDIWSELRELPPADLARTIFEGRVAPEGSGRFYDLDPIPNALFMRDPAPVVGAGVVIASMARSSRVREALVMRQIFRAAPRFAGSRVRIDPLAVDRPPGSPRPTIEGGDVLVPSADIVLLGISERTNLQGADLLARDLAREGRFRDLVLVSLPKERYAMHLDTVFTFIDHHHALVFPPFFEPGRGCSRVQCIELTGRVAREGLPAFDPSEELLPALSRIGLPVEPIPIGGPRLIDQLREQWTDGCNALCLEPGRILLYNRNFHTLEALADRGYRVLTAPQFLARADYYRAGEDRFVIALEAAELSRARGGPRCMSMPLRRRV